MSSGRCLLGGELPPRLAWDPRSQPRLSLSLKKSPPSWTLLPRSLAPRPAPRRPRRGRRHALPRPGRRRQSGLPRLRRRRQRKLPPEPGPRADRLDAVVVGSSARAGDRPIAIVTGATSGIGRWIALGMARARHHVIVIGRDRARGR